MKKILAILMTLITLLNFASFSIYASENAEVSPCLNNGSNSTSRFGISSSGLSEVSVSYNGIKGTTTKVTITTYIQKKTLGLFWTKVDIGAENKEWIDTLTDVNGYISHKYQLSSTGTYRAVIKIVFSGTGGSDDEIEDKIEKKYS